uniref:Putative light-regulated protein n=1 Tax=Davidia involucrata TaxID=16924 RepID=A0A5B7C9Q8_DAVIN
MQAVLYIIPPSSIPLVAPTKTLPSAPWKTIPRLQISHSIKVTATPYDTSAVDYSSTASVFPAEACDTIGGEACDAEMYPEVKLDQEPKSNTPKTASEMVDREYLEYDSPKTVFPAEACDDLGGEFCDPEYQEGVY